MTYRHDYHGDNPLRVGVGELIHRIGREGLPTRLANWPERIVSDGMSVEDWPTGELPRFTDRDDRNGCRSGHNTYLGYGGVADERTESPEASTPLPPTACGSNLESTRQEELWGNRGPRPYQRYAEEVGQGGRR